MKTSAPMNARAFVFVSVLAFVACLATGRVANAQPTAAGPAPQPEIEIDAEPPLRSEGPAAIPEPTPPTLRERGSELPPPTATATAEEVAALRATVADLAARLASMEASRAVEPVVAVPAPSSTPIASAAPSDARPRWWRALDLRVSGYVQTQLQFSQFSQSEISPDGTSLNLDHFIIRRGRLRVDRTWKYANLAFEIDASTTRGPFMGVRRAETSFFVPSRHAGGPPLVMVTAGLTDVPFGFEVRQSPRLRWFLERSAGSLAFQRGEPDLGVRISGGVGLFRYAFAVMNGSPLDDSAGGSQFDLAVPKELIGRVGVENDDRGRVRFRVGVSFESGKGLHVGTPATKPTVFWRDTNEDGLVQSFEVTGVPARSATPSVEFGRWGLNTDIGIAVKSRLGWSELYGEITMATNLDRSSYVADPIATGYDLREVAWYVAFLQEITEYAVVGFRVDYYDPNADLMENRRGISAPVPTSQITFSPMIGGQLPGFGRLVIQYDHIRDHLGRTATGDATDLRNDLFVIRLQTEF